MSTTYESPYLLARKFSTLDHLTGGRIGWNIVTSLLDSAARNIIGRDRQIPHDERYAIAEEFVEVTYKLWEGSWEPDAVVRDREGGVFTDPAKVHAIGHEGKYFSVPGAHLVQPSPQRSPVLFQAGTSPAGREFAARNAELVFASDPRPDVLRANIDDIKRRAAAHGRKPDSIKFLTSIEIVVDSTDSAARGEGRRPGEVSRPRGRPRAAVGALRRRLVAVRRGPTDRAVRHRRESIDTRRGRRLRRSG